MDRGSNKPAAKGVAELGAGIVEDAQRLIGQQFELLRSEFKQELGKAKEAALALSSGLGLAAVGGLMGSLMVVELLHSATRLPRWSCYGLVASALTASGMSLLARGAAKAREVELIPRRSMEALREDAAALTGR